MSAGYTHRSTVNLPWISYSCWHCPCVVFERSFLMWPRLWAENSSCQLSTSNAYRMAVLESPINPARDAAFLTRCDLVPWFNQLCQIATRLASSFQATLTESLLWGQKLLSARGSMLAWCLAIAICYMCGQQCKTSQIIRVPRTRQNQGSYQTKCSALLHQRKKDLSRLSCGVLLSFGQLSFYTHCLDNVPSHMVQKCLSLVQELLPVF